MPETMRIQRAIARAGVASRRAADELVAAGRVRINGRVAVIGQSVDPVRDEIQVDGKPLAAPPTEAHWLVLHNPAGGMTTPPHPRGRKELIHIIEDRPVRNKPAGVLTTRYDPSGRKTVFDIIEDSPGLTYVGRLDYMTEGVLLLTNDGEAAHKLTHPSGEVERTYVATVRGDGAGAARVAMKGVELEDGVVVPREFLAKHVGRGMWDLQITIAEGRTREVRRLCEALDLQVQRLVRIKFGPVKLGQLPTGKTRQLTGREKDIITALTKSGGNKKNTTRGSRRERTNRYSR